MYDVVIVGGGPAGLSAALALGRARKRTLLLDAGNPRNARAHEVHNFVTRDGIAPQAFRRIAREQLVPYESVEVCDQRVLAIDGVRDDFVVQLEAGPTRARRIILCTGMIDQLPTIPGFAELWGHAIFQCPYCHGWEVRDRAFGYLARAVEMVEWALVLLGWTRDLTVFTNGAYRVPAALADKLAHAGIALEQRPIRSLRADESGTRLLGLTFEDGGECTRDVLFAHPPQRHAELVTSLGLTLDEQGFVRVDALERQTSRAGIYAAGDLSTPMQAAMQAANTGLLAAARINHELTLLNVSETHAE